ESIDDDQRDKEAIKATVAVYDYKEGSQYFDIAEIQDPVMRMAVHLVTKINDHKRWTQ
ncbi:hypothetical protein KI387_013591, partial [Taxus chinensis]